MLPLNQPSSRPLSLKPRSPRTSTSFGFSLSSLRIPPSRLFGVKQSPLSRASIGGGLALAYSCQRVQLAVCYATPGATSLAISRHGDATAEVTPHPLSGKHWRIPA